MQVLQFRYTRSFNRRYEKVGHLFQGRYKAILCEKDAYLLELVRYIHLNPLRAKLVESIRELNTYVYSGHSVLMGKKRAEWQDVNKVLGMFSSEASSARKRYRDFIEKVNERVSKLFSLSKQDIINPSRRKQRVMARRWTRS